jgi:dTDP-4-dehydrorhamnose reductase
MKAAILGADGQLGRALSLRFPDAAPLQLEDVDIADYASVEAFEWDAFDTVLNAAGYTAVDAAETAAGRCSAWKANAVGPRNLAQVAIRHGLTLVHVSSDYVFDGSVSCHLETEQLSPLGVYGQSKAAGDIAVSLAPNHYILRVSWLVGDGANFVRTMAKLAAAGEPVSVVGDQIGRLTFTQQLVDAIDHVLLTRPPPGTYNCSNDGEPVSWADIARVVFTERGRSPELVDPVDTVAYCDLRPETAPRPRQSTLNLAKIKAVGVIPRDWKAGLLEYLRQDQL